jgi:mannose-6-phosphate isomerase class I
MCHTVCMSLKKYRWSKVYESAEEELQEFLAARNITAQRHDVEAYDEQTIQATGAARIWGVEGTASFTADGKRYSMQPGDVLELPANTACTVTTGLSNFAWYQSA